MRQYETDNDEAERPPLVIFDELRYFRRSGHNNAEIATGIAAHSPLGPGPVEDERSSPGPSA